VIIRVYGVLLECAVTAEVSGVRTEHAFIEVLEGRVAVNTFGYDSRPLGPTTVAGSPLGESFEFAICIASVVSAVATTAFPLVLEIPFEGVRER